MTCGKDSKTYCVHLFSQVATDNLGYLRPCCQNEIGVFNKNKQRIHLEMMTPMEFFNSDPIKDMRRKASSGERIEGCQSCYDMEDNGVTSMRQRDNEKYQWIIEEVGDKIDQPKIHSLDFRAGNLCNLGCVMCGPSASSKLDKLFKEHGSATFSYFHENMDEFRQDHDIRTWYKNPEIIEGILNDTREISKLWLLGGEPLYNDVNFRLLDRLKGKGKDLELEVSTNVTRVSPEIIETLEHFKTVLKCSIDGTGATSDYIRFPSKFSEIEENLIALAKARLKLELVFTVSALNIFNIGEFCHWLQELGDKHNRVFDVGFSNIVTAPNYLDPRNLPADLKDEAINAIKSIAGEVESGGRVRTWGTLDHLAEFTASDGDFQIMKDGWKYLDNFDKHRGNDWRAAAPKLVPYMEPVG